MHCPKTIRIGATSYKLNRKNRVPDDNGRSLYGEIDYNRCEINIDKNPCAQMQNLTIWHEVVHGILRQYNFSEERNNERLVDSLAQGIIQVLKDNKALREPWE